MYIVLQTRWDDEKDKRVVEYCEWKSLQEDYVVNQEITNFFIPFGNLLSISPSHQFGLFAKPSNDKSLWDVYLPPPSIRLFLAFSGLKVRHPSRRILRYQFILDLFVKMMMFVVIC